jgi:hypothetical protein
MKKDLKMFYVGNLNNRTVIFDSNLRKFIEKLNNIEPASRNYQYYCRQFGKSSEVVYLSPEDKVYVLQRIV